MSNFAKAVYPVPNRYIDLGKEVAPGSIAAATYTFPMTQFKPVDKYTMLPDSAWRNAMGDLYNYIQGVRIADVSMGGPFFADGMGYPLCNVMGDYYQSVASGTSSATTQLGSNSAIGAGTIVVSSATGISVNEIIAIGGTASTSCEVRKVTNIAGTSPGTLTLSSALYQSHGSASTSGTVVAFTTYSGIQHNFALLNNGLGAGGWTASQPPTYTYYDFSGVPAVTGARQYGYSCFSEVSITSDPTKLLEWDGKMQALASQIAASTPPVSLSAVAPPPAWESTVTLGGAGTFNCSNYKLTLQRKIGAKYTNSGQQDFFALPRGYLSAMLALDFDPASDESEYLYYLNNNQPSCVLNSTNGLSGTLASSLAITAGQIGFDSGELNDSKEVFGYDMAAKLVDNTTNVGPSGGFGPCIVSLINQVVSY
jgi:hypothetical protein